MRPTVDNNRGDAERHSPPALRVILAILTSAVALAAGYLILWGAPWAPDPQRAAQGVVEETETPAIATGGASTTAASNTARPSDTNPQTDNAPSPGRRSVIPSTEVEPEAKQLAADLAYRLTTYEAWDDHHARLEALTSHQGTDSLAAVSEPLTHPGRWSRGEVIYPQLGGLATDRASVMVVTRQTVGSGSRVEFSVTRTLDIRLVRGAVGWEFDFLSSAGGTFDRVEDLATAHAVASDPRIFMPDSARLDILAGQVSPKLLELMAALAEQTSFEVVVLATGHPRNVFETDRLSHHTVGQAVDINRIGERLVVDDRAPDSATRAVVEWLYQNPDVGQVGSPWDIDGEASRRSFTDEVHQDHIHLAVDD